MRIDFEMVLERAAIMQWDGGLPQAEAEQRAENLLLGEPDSLVESWLDYQWH